MVKKIISLLLCIILFITFCGCRAKTEGNTLFAFTQRLNDATGYEITTDGYIHNKEENTFTKFFNFPDREIMLQFKYGKNNTLTSLNIVFDNLEEKHTEEITFIENVIYSFADNEQEASKCLKKLNYPQSLYKPVLNTEKANAGNTDILIDVTDIGTVITVVKNTL